MRTAFNRSINLQWSHSDSFARPVTFIASVIRSYVLEPSNLYLSVIKFKPLGSAALAPIFRRICKCQPSCIIGESRMMPGPEAYTPFERFTLVHALYSSGTSDSPFFAELSDSMKSNIFITSDDSYNPGRLEPNSLKILYQQLLIGEVERTDHETVLKLGTDGIGRDNPRKRKLSDPSMLWSAEGPLQMELLLSLMDRLYFTYRDQATKVIQDEERRYRLLQQEIQEINKGEWDVRLENQEIAAKKDSRGVSYIQTILRQDSDLVKPGLESPAQIVESPPVQEKPSTDSTPGPIRMEGLPQTEVVQAKEFKGQAEGETLQTSSETANQLPKAEPALNHSQAQELVPTASGNLKIEPSRVAFNQDFNARPPPLALTEAKTPFLPPPQPSHSVYPSTSAHLETNNRRVPYLPAQSQTMAAPLPSPNLNQTSLAQQERLSQSPIILPPPAGMLRSTAPRPGPLDALADMAGQQFRSNPPLPSPTPVQHGSGQPHPIQLSQPQNFSQPVYSYYDNQQTYGVPYQPYGQNPIPNYHRSSNPNGHMYQGPPTHAGLGEVYGNIPHYQSPPLSYSQYPAYSQNPSYYQTPVQPYYPLAQASSVTEQHTPVSTRYPRHRPAKPSSIRTSTVVTKWKTLDLPGPVTNPGSPVRPRPEEISPISDKAPSPVPEFHDIPESPLNEPRSRNARGHYVRGRRGQRRGARAGSAASSSVAGSMQTRTRSHSVLSHADELSMDNTMSSHAWIKPEPPATPVVGEDTEITETMVDEGSIKPVRRRREPIRGLQVGPGMERAGMKRKVDEIQEPQSVRSGLTSNASNKHPHFILGSRNFPRTSATIMNDISAHKLASMFAKPLTEREAPGYKDLIYRPQDLKSIKSAIMAGSKALVAAAENTGSGGPSNPTQTGLGTPNSKGANLVWVPATADVMPPKGIVNSAQLEKELMRMFANAVMFNPDPKRGVGPTFRDAQRAATKRTRRKADGGDDVRAAAKRGEEETEEPPSQQRNTNDDNGGDEEEDEGGVVRDTREMFAAVEKSVADWRAAERAAERAVEDAMVVVGLGAGLGGGRKAPKRDDDGMADELAGDEERMGESVVGSKRKRR